MISDAPPIPHRAALIRSADFYFSSTAVAEGATLDAPPQLNAIKRIHNGFALYFTIRYDRLPAAQVKVCETRTARVFGASNLSVGQRDCEHPGRVLPIA